MTVQRDAQGAFVLTVGKDNVVEAKRVNVVGTSGVNWVVNQGLVDGDRLIVAGLQLARPGGKVTPKPLEAPPVAPGAPVTPAPAAGS
jgi:membrane fusion protein (multidrug efflux system)